MLRFQLRTKIILLTVSVMALLLTMVTLLTFSVSSDIVHHNVNQNAQSQVKTHSLQLANWLETRIAELEMMRFSSTIQSGDEASIIAYFQEELTRQKGLYTSFAMSDQKGDSYSSQHIYTNIAKDPYFQEALTGKTVLSNPEPSLENPNNLIVRFYIPIMNQKKQVEQILLAETNSNAVFQNNTSFKIGSGDVVYVVDQSGAVIYHPDADKIQTHQLISGTLEEKELLHTMQTHKEGMYQSTFFNLVPNTSWFLVWDVPKGELTAPLVTLLNLSFSSIIVAAFLMGVFMLILLQRTFKRLHRLMSFTSSIASGNIHIDPLPETGRDEITALSHANNQMLLGLQGIFKQLNEGVSQSADAVSVSSQELSQSTEETMHAAKQIATMIENVTEDSVKQMDTTEQNVALMQEMLSGIDQITHATEHVNQTATMTFKKAQNGIGAMEETKKQMEKIQQTVQSSFPTMHALNDRAEEIEQIVDVINGLTTRINLLSLNASIEAARAGEQGKGFKVVADEVKKLAHETSVSANQITSLIQQTQQNVYHTEQMMDSIQNEVTEGMQITADTAHSFEDIANSVEAVTDQVREISLVANELLTGSQHILTTFHDLMDNTKLNHLHFHSVSSAAAQQVASMEHMTEYAETLTRMSQELHQLIRTIDL